MRCIAAAMLMLMGSSVAMAEPTTQPATVAPPATQPSCDVLLTPFSPLGDNSLDWAGKAVAQNLMTDLARQGYHPLESEKPLSTADALSAGKSVDAKFLITGTYQSIEQEVRFTGQIVDISTSKVVGGISATGAPRDLFALEDSLSSQTIHQLTQLPTAAAKAPAVLAPNPALQPAQLIQVIAPPAVAAPNVGSAYQGSALQAYVDSNRTPSVEFSQQVQNSQTQLNYGSPYGGIGIYSPYWGAYGGYGPGYGVGIYVGVPYGGYSHGGGLHGWHGRSHDHVDGH